MSSPALPIALLVSPDSLDPEHVCPACSGILSSPVITCVEDEHLPCELCLDRAKGCAGCNGKPVDIRGSVGRKNKSVGRSIAKLKVRCRRECGWEGKLADLSSHDEQCSLPIPCSNAFLGCTATPPGQAALKTHLEADDGCGYKKVECERGWDAAARQQRCELSGYMRKDAEKHAEDCTVSTCPTRGPRSCIREHSPYCRRVHRENGELKDKLKERDAALVEKDSRISTLEAVVEARDDEVAVLKTNRDADQKQIAELTANVAAFQAARQPSSSSAPGQSRFQKSPFYGGKGFSLPAPFSHPVASSSGGARPARLPPSLKAARTSRPRLQTLSPLLHLRLCPPRPSSSQQLRRPPVPYVDPSRKKYTTRSTSTQADKSSASAVSKDMGKAPASSAPTSTADASKRLRESHSSTVGPEEEEREGTDEQDKPPAKRPRSRGQRGR
ncbi:hypothetical protein JCM8547_002756 [Rhodosporidiobolus lusitaniae]